MARIGQVLRGEKTWGQWWLDQLGHTGLGAAYALPVAVLCAWLDLRGAMCWGLGAALALAGGVAREVWQYLDSGKPHLPDRTLDVLFHLPGVAVAFGLVALAKALL